MSARIRGGRIGTCPDECVGSVQHPTVRRHLVRHAHGLTTGTLRPWKCRMFRVASVARRD